MLFQRVWRRDASCVKIFKIKVFCTKTSRTIPGGKNLAKGILDPTRFIQRLIPGNRDRDEKKSRVSKTRAKGD